jgi:hypothetical protein
VLCLKRIWNTVFTVNAKECWQMELLHHNNAQPHTAAVTKWFKNWYVSFSSTQHTVQISHDLITVFPDNSKTYYVDTNGNIPHRCHQEAQKDWSNKCVEKVGDYTEKMTVHLLLYTFCRIKKTINCPYFNSPHIEFLLVKPENNTNCPMYGSTGIYTSFLHVQWLTSWPH